MLIFFYLMPVKTSCLKTLNVSFGKFTSRHSSLTDSLIRPSDIIAPQPERIYSAYCFLTVLQAHCSAQTLPWTPLDLWSAHQMWFSCDCWVPTQILHSQGVPLYLWKAYSCSLSISLTLSWFIYLPRQSWNRQEMKYHCSWWFISFIYWCLLWQCITRSTLHVLSVVMVFLKSEPGKLKNVDWWEWVEVGKSQFHSMKFMPRSVDSFFLVEE